MFPAPSDVGSVPGGRGRTACAHPLRPTVGAFVPWSNRSPTLDGDHPAMERHRPSLRGIGMFVWYLEAAGAARAVAARARDAGLGHVLVKCGDGGEPWGQFSADLVGALHDAGVEAHGWAYCYG